MKEFSNKLNPFPVAVSILSTLNSDAFLTIVQSAGIDIDLSLNDADNYSHKTRVRAYIPRVREAIKGLDDDDALQAIYLIFDELLTTHKSEVESRLHKIGWDIVSGSLMPKCPNVIELYFEKGLIHTAYQEIRALVKTSTKEIYIIDPYVDSSIFEMLKMLDSGSVSVKILTLNLPADFTHEKNLFLQQYSNLSIEERKTKDFHDRFIVIDRKDVYHLGASIKDAGKKVFMINKIEDPIVCKSMISSFDSRWT